MKIEGIKIATCDSCGGMVAVACIPGGMASDESNWTMRGTTTTVMTAEAYHANDKLVMCVCWKQTGER